jgi:hypothetical protein
MLLSSSLGGLNRVDPPESWFVSADYFEVGEGPQQ